MLCYFKIFKMTSKRLLCNNQWQLFVRGASKQSTVIETIKKSFELVIHSNNFQYFAQIDCIGNENNQLKIPLTILFLLVVNTNNFADIQHLQNKIIKMRKFQNVSWIMLLLLRLMVTINRPFAPILFIFIEKYLKNIITKFLFQWLEFSSITMFSKYELNQSHSWSCIIFFMAEEKQGQGPWYGLS